MEPKVCFHPVGYTFGLTALLPGVFNVTPAGLSQHYLFQIMASDVFVAVFVLISFALYQICLRVWVGIAWFFSIVRVLDYLNTAARVTRLTIARRHRAKGAFDESFFV